jgi:tetratricopeptide (TPR) repeat protein/predicted enzyme related to lactoylglutathione lyase
MSGWRRMLRAGVLPIGQRRPTAGRSPAAAALGGTIAVLVLILASTNFAQDPHATHRTASLPRELVERPLPLRGGIGAAHDAVSTMSPQAQAFYDQGLAYLHSFVWIEAARSFHQALRLDPTLAMAGIGLSFAYIELNAPAEAHAALERARALAPAASMHDRLHIDVRTAQLAAEDAPHDAARLAAYRAALDEALARCPSDEELWLQRGAAESLDPSDRGQGSPPAAARFYERALQLAPNHFAAHHYLTHVFENGGRPAEALTHAAAYAAMAPAIPHAHHMHGHELRRLGRIEEAIAEFETADRLETEYFEAEHVPVELDWHYHHNLDLLATSYEYVGQMAKAERLLKAAFAIPSQLIVQEFNKREWPMFLLARGRIDEALAAANVLMNHASPIVRAAGHVEAGHAMLASARFESAAQESNAALRELKSAVDGAGLVADALEALQGEFFLRTGQREKGRAMLEEAIRKERAAPGPDNWIRALFTIERIASAARAVDDWELADRVAHQMLEHDPAYAGTHYALALAAAHAGADRAAADEFALAERHWSRADPDLPELAKVRTEKTSGRASGFLQAPDAPEPAGFHHVHLNSVDPAGSVAFYTKTFDVTKKTSLAGFEAVHSEHMYLLFTRVASPASAELDTAIWHFGWGSPDVEADYQRHVVQGVPFATPLTKLGTGTLFAYLRAPDGNLVEINTAQTNAFTHVHMFSAAPLCAADWYERFLGATRAQGRGQTPPADCHVPFAAPSEPLGVIRQPSAIVRLDDINLIIYPQQKPASLASTRGRVTDHIAVSYPDVATALDRLQKMGVKVLEGVHNFGNTVTRAAMIEGPDGVAIELVERPAGGKQP